MQKYIISFIVLTISLMSFAPSTVFAADAGCKKLYGGGVTQEQACNGKTPTKAPVNNAAKATPTPTKAPSKQLATSKGGLPVVSPTPVKTTPSTGPELLGLIALAPAAAAGIYLRKKS